MNRTTASFHNNPTQNNLTANKNSSIDKVFGTSQDGHSNHFHNSIKNMLSEEDFVKLNVTIHNKLAAAQSVNSKIIEEPHNEENERDDECAVVFRARNNKTPIVPKQEAEESY
jgi:RNA-binding protein YhbY